MMRRIFIFAMSSLIPMACFAHDFDYTFVEGGWNNQTVTRSASDGSRKNGNGGYLYGSWQFAEHAYLFGSYSYASVKYHGPSIDIPPIELDQKFSRSIPQIGIGFRKPINEFDLLTEASYVREKDSYKETVGKDFFVRDSGNANILRFLVGARAQLLPQLDSWVKVGYTDGDYYDDRFVGILGSQYHFTSSWSLVAQVELDHISTQWEIGARLHF